jgi:predicted enzyme related to lactoylglutathione lyase
MSQKPHCIFTGFWEVQRDNLNHQNTMSKKNSGPRPGDFCWNELVTTSVPAAKKFYAALLGWKTRPFDKGMVDYTIIQKGKTGMGGIMKCPKPGLPAQWIPYILVADVDATVKKAAKLRGKIFMPPFDVPTVGRIAVLADPQGAAFGIIAPKM